MCFCLICVVLLLCVCLLVLFVCVECVDVVCVFVCCDLRIWCLLCWHNCVVCLVFGLCDQFVMFGFACVTVFVCV